MAEVRPVDANDLMRDVLGLTIVSPEVMNYANAVAVAIANTSTIDAVPVVRCRECWRHQTANCPMFLRGGDYAFHDGFCHLGARMDAKEDDNA